MSEPLSRAPELLQLDYLHKNATPHSKVFPSFLGDVFFEGQVTDMSLRLNLMFYDLSDLCVVYENNIFGFIHGGATRKHQYLINGNAEKLKSNITELPPELVGDDDLTKKALHSYEDTTDLDLRYVKRNGVSDDDIQKRLLYSIGRYQMHKLYDIYLNKLVVGDHKSITLFKLDFYKPGADPVVDRAIFKADIGDLAVNKIQQNDSIRNGILAADLDMIGTTYLAKTDNYLLNVITYHTRDDSEKPVTFGDALLRSRFLSPETLHPSEYANHLVQALSSQFRQVGSRADAFFLYITSKYSETQYEEFQELMIEQTPPFLPLPIIRNIIHKEKENIKARLVPLMTDMLYPFITNPVIALPLLYRSQAFHMTPLGQLISDPEKLQNVTQALTRRMRAEFKPHSSADPDYDFPNTLHLLSLLSSFQATTQSGFGPLLLIDALKDVGLISSETPRTVSSFVKLLNPLELIINEV